MCAMAVFLQGAHYFKADKLGRLSSVSGLGDGFRSQMTNSEALESSRLSVCLSVRTSQLKIF